jgi:hypothetical protein
MQYIRVKTSDDEVFNVNSVIFYKSERLRALYNNVNFSNDYHIFVLDGINSRCFNYFLIYYQLYYSLITLLDDNLVNTMLSNFLKYLDDNNFLTSFITSASYLKAKTMHLNDQNYFVNKSEKNKHLKEKIDKYNDYHKNDDSLNLQNMSNWIYDKKWPTSPTINFSDWDLDFFEEINGNKDFAFERLIHLAQ